MVSSKDESATDNDKLSGEVSDSNSSLYSEGEKLAQGESSSQSSCPKQFTCGNLGNVGFPFSNVSRPECGLYTLDCNASPYPTITLAQHQYGVRFIGDNFMKLFDPLLGKQICNVFNTGISFPSSPSISFEFMFAMEFYKCNHSSSNNVSSLQKIEHYFSGYKSYNSCQNFSLYYTQVENDTLPAASLPAECSVIYLPFDRSSRAMDLFEKLNSSMLYLQWKMQGKQSPTSAFSSLQLVESKPQSICPKLFSCGNLRNLSFPFSNNNVSRPECGLYTLSCGATPHPTIALGQHQYEVLITVEQLMLLFDPLLDKYLRKRSCNVFHRGISIPSSPSISFEFGLTTMFYKCNRTSNIGFHKIDDYFRGYKSYNSCEGFSLYYSEEDNHNLPDGGFPAECSVVRLPFNRTSNASDLFGKLNSSILIGWKLSESCVECHYKGGRCLTDGDNAFHCADSAEDAGKNEPNKVILILIVIILDQLAQGESSSQSSCPKEFTCGHIRNVSFPFSNVSRPECGLYTLDCNATPIPTITLGQHKYGVEFIVGEFMFLFDPLLDKYLRERSYCNVFHRGFSFPSSASISFEFQPESKFYKCNRTSNVSSLQEKIDHYFHGYRSYSSCQNFTLYYNQGDNNHTLPASSLPAECSLIHLPFDKSSRAIDLFEKLNSSIFVEWKVSEICAKCHYNGGQCLTDTHNNFHCSSDAGKKELPKGIHILLQCAIGLIIFGPFTSCVIVIVLRCRKKKGHGGSPQLSTNWDLEGCKLLGVHVFSYSQLEKATDYFHSDRELGDGGFGTVYHEQVVLLKKIGRFPTSPTSVTDRCLDSGSIGGSRACKFYGKVSLLGNEGSIYTATEGNTCWAFGMPAICYTCTGEIGILTRGLDS
nr:LEAF RUST 10 DISEASE-RESISTANCE LOCUS RECEPTOR-LIKE PROTEIN KINASE-like 1.1 [Ipomoea batatas]